MRDLINKGDDEGLQIKQFVEHRGIKLSLGICRRTAFNWMILAGMKFTETRQTYYTDAHNRPDVVKYRTEYIARRKELALRQPVYIQQQFDDGVRVGVGVRNVHVDTLHDDLYLSTRAKHPMGGELHSHFDSYAASAKANCKYGHDVCKCDKPVWLEGQDESCYKCHSTSKMRWILNDQQPLLKKGDGVDLMWSATVSEERGFGFPLTQAEVDYVNTHIDFQGDEKLVFNDKTPFGSPGLISFKYGANREGYWDHTNFMEQCEKFIRVLKN